MKMGDVEKGATFEIILKANPHSGYLWYYEGTGGQRSYSLVTEEMQPLPRYSGTKQHFYFKADSVGLDTIPFVYKRIWEDAPYATFEMVIKVIT